MQYKNTVWHIFLSTTTWSMQVNNCLKHERVKILHSKIAFASCYQKNLYPNRKKTKYYRGELMWTIGYTISKQLASAYAVLLNKIHVSREIFTYVYKSFATNIIMKCSLLLKHSKSVDFNPPSQQTSLSWNVHFLTFKISGSQSIFATNISIMKCSLLNIQNQWISVHL